MRITDQTKTSSYRKRKDHMTHIHTCLVLPAAAAAMLFAGTSAKAQDVKINIGLGAPPQLVVVPGTSVYNAPDVPSNYSFYKGRYYTVVNGVSSMAPSYNRLSDRRIWPCGAAGRGAACADGGAGGRPDQRGAVPRGGAVPAHRRVAARTIFSASICSGNLSLPGPRHGSPPIGEVVGAAGGDEAQSAVAGARQARRGS
jgi:hypothetical protein